MKIHTILGFLLSLILMMACSDNPSLAPEFKLFVDEMTIEYRGQNADYDYIILRPQEGCTFHSENPFIATVSSDGIVSPAHLGSTYITVTKGSETLRCKINVISDYSYIRDEFKALPIDNLGLSRQQLLAKLGNSQNITEDGDFIMYGKFGSNSYNEHAYIYQIGSSEVESCFVSGEFRDEIYEQVYSIPAFHSFSFTESSIKDGPTFNVLVYINAYSVEECTQWVAEIYNYKFMTTMNLFSNQSQYISDSLETLEAHIKEQIGLIFPQSVEQEEQEKNLPVDYWGMSKEDLMASLSKEYILAEDWNNTLLTWSKSQKSLYPHYIFHIGSSGVDCVATTEHSSAVRDVYWKYPEIQSEFIAEEHLPSAWKCNVEFYGNTIKKEDCTHWAAVCPVGYYDPEQSHYCMFSNRPEILTLDSENLKNHIKNIFFFLEKPYINDPAQYSPFPINYFGLSLSNLKNKIGGSEIYGENRLYIEYDHVISGCISYVFHTGTNGIDSCLGNSLFLPAVQIKESYTCYPTLAFSFTGPAYSCYGDINKNWDVAIYGDAPTPAQCSHWVAVMENGYFHLFSNQTQLLTGPKEEFESYVKNAFACKE